MKVFIVSLAMLLVFVSFLAFSADMDRYVQMQEHLKALAEDCAAGCALFTDEEAYSEGVMVIDSADARAYTAFLIGKAQKSMPPLANGAIEASVRIFDDRKGYEGITEYGLVSGIPGSAVTLTYTGEDIFRLPFITVTDIRRTAAYQWEN